jgi:hypothetical protein
MQELQIRQMQAESKAQTDQAKIQLDAQKAAQNAELERERIAAQERMAGASIGQKMASDLLDAEQENKKEARKEYQKGVDIGIKLAEDSSKNDK